MAYLDTRKWNTFEAQSGPRKVTISVLLNSYWATAAQVEVWVEDVTPIALYEAGKAALAQYECFPEARITHVSF